MTAMQAEKEHLLDLLVDGELSEADRRELLLWCERDPEGWRRCALAFLEAQSWSKELASIGEPEASASVSSERRVESHYPEADASGSPGNGSPASMTSKSTSAAVRSAPPWRTVGWSLAMAASFLVSFALGLWARGGWLLSSSSESGAAPANMVAERELIDQLHREPLDRNALARDAAPAAVPAAPREALGQVRLVVDGPNGASDEIELPVVEANDFNAEFLRSGPAAIPLEVERALERLGHRVQQRRELVPLRLQDGRRLIVPVDQVEVHPVGNRAYQ